MMATSVREPFSDKSFGSTRNTEWVHLHVLLGGSSKNQRLLLHSLLLLESSQAHGLHMGLDHSTLSWVTEP